MRRVLAFFVAVAAVAACSSASLTNAPGAGSQEAPPPSGDAPDAATLPPRDAAADAPADVAADAPNLGTCVGTFGSALGVGFGRIDGTLVAIVRPVDQHCPLPNSDHIILEVMMNGAVYRMVANVHSDQGGADPRVQYLSLAHALPEPAFAEGQHVGAALDYATTLGVHSTSFQPLDQDPLVDTIVAALKVGDPISVYATVGAGHTDSAHLIHRNGTSDDGAIVVGPTSAAPTFLLFHFDEQTF